MNMRNLVISLVIVTVCLIGSIIYFSNKLANQDDSFKKIESKLASKELLVSQANAEKAQFVKSLDEKMTALETAEKELASVKTDLDSSVQALSDSKEKLKVAQLEAEQAKAQLSGSNVKMGELAKELDVARLNAAQSTHVKLVDQLTSEIGKQDIKVQDMGGKLKLSLSNKILFPSAMTTLTEEGLAVLERLGNILKDVDDKIIRVEGHTDNVKIRYRLKEKYPTNWELSASRATNVVRFLIDKVGVDPKKVYAVGMSKYHPIGDNNSSSGRSLNRRIEIMLETVTDVKEVRELQLVGKNDETGVEDTAEINSSVKAGSDTFKTGDASSILDVYLVDPESSNEFDNMAEPEIITETAGVNSNETTKVSTTVNGTEIERKSDSKSLKKPFSYSTGRSKSGVGYIWVKKRITDFPSE